MTESDDFAAQLLLDKLAVRDCVADRALRADGQDAPGRHYLTSHISDIDGDRAQAQTNGILVAQDGDGVAEIAGVRFLDRLERQPDGWKLAERRVLTEWVGAAPRGTADAEAAR